MIPRIFFLLAAGLLPVCAQSSLNDGGRMIPENQPTVQPVAPSGPATLQPSVTAPPAGTPVPADQMPAMPAVRCYLKEFTVSPSAFRIGMIYKYDLKTYIKLNVPARRIMTFHIVSNDPARVTCSDIVILRNVQSGFGGIKIITGAIVTDSKFDLKAYSDDDPTTILHGRLYVKPRQD